MSNVSVIIFDLGNVIVRVSHREIAQALSAGSADPRFHNPDHALAAAFDDTRGLTVAYEEGRLSTEAFYRTVTAAMGLSITAEDFARRWNTGFWENTDVSALIHRLHGRYRLLLLSNTNELHYRHLEPQLPVLSLMERKILSYEVGMRKPSRAIYDRAIAMAGVAPEQIVYIDDVAVYTHAAAQLGIQAITFQSAEQLEPALRERGVVL
jgi:FMN phosphatase YigB (HAD superfamily)